VVHLVCIDRVHVVCYFLLLGEHLSVEVSLLLIETYMSTYRLSKAASQIGLLEVKLYGGPLGAGNGKAEGEGEGPAQQCRPQLHLFKARLHLLHKNVKACKKEVKNFISTAGNVSSMICRSRNYMSCVHPHCDLCPTLLHSALLISAKEGRTRFGCLWYN